MAEQRWDDRFIEEHTEEIIKKNLAELVKINVSVGEAKREVKARSKGLRVFSERYIAETPKVIVASHCPYLTTHIDVIG
jgi:DNA replication ATP-dependent helicase Dna2